MVLDSARGKGASGSIWNRFEATQTNRSSRSTSTPFMPSVSVTTARSSARALTGAVNEIEASQTTEISTSGMTLAKARQNLGEEEFGIIVGYAEPDAAAQSLARQRGERARLDLHHAPGEIDQLLAFFREAGAAPLFDEKRAAELLFEPAHMHRHRRLRLVHAFGGAGEGAGVDDGEEGAELVGVEHDD